MTLVYLWQRALEVVVLKELLILPVRWPSFDPNLNLNKCELSFGRIHNSLMQSYSKLANQIQLSSKLSPKIR
jgi:hypothetical protein